MKEKLVKEAISRGFGLAKKWRSPTGTPYTNYDRTLEWDYFKETDTLFLNFGVVYRRGKWATITEHHK